MRPGEDPARRRPRSGGAREPARDDPHPEHRPVSGLHRLALPARPRERGARVPSRGSRGCTPGAPGGSDGPHRPGRRGRADLGRDGSDRADYASIYGPTTGTGYGSATPTRRRGRGRRHGPRQRAARRFREDGAGGAARERRIAPDEALDVAITNVVVIDRRSASGRPRSESRTAASRRSAGAGNPDTMDDVVVPLSSSTGVVPGEGLIATAGAIDCARPPARPAGRPGGPLRRHDNARRDGLRRRLRPGDRPRLQLRPAARRMARRPAEPAAAAARARRTRRCSRQLLALGAGRIQGARGRRRLPRAVVDAALSVADRHDVQLALHADGIGESATLEETLAASGGGASILPRGGVRRGAGRPARGGGLPNVLPSSTDPTVPFGEAACRARGHDPHRPPAASALRERPRRRAGAASAPGRWPPRASSTISARSA